MIDYVHGLRLKRIYYISSSSKVLRSHSSLGGEHTLAVRSITIHIGRKVELREGRHDIATLENIPGVLPFEIYAQAPLRLISELDNRSKTLLRDLAVMCESATTSTKQLVDKIAQHHANVHTEQEAIEYVAILATVQIASRANAQLHNYGPTLPRDTEIADGNLYVGLLPADAEPT